METLDILAMIDLACSEPQKVVQNSQHLYGFAQVFSGFSGFFRICRILQIFLSAGVIRQVENPR